MPVKPSVIAQQTRLFPKNNGADAYNITGIAAKCDWVVLSDVCEPHVHLVKQVETPRFIYLSLRAPFAALQYFYECVLPQMNGPFVLVSGSEDVTIPVQTDIRWREYNEAENHIIHAIQTHPLLVHWFAENLVGNDSDVMSPLPLGLVFPDSQTSPVISLPDSTPLAERPNTVFCAHRVRQGGQWERRRKVTELATTAWQDFCVSCTDEMSEPDFYATIQQHSFVICVEGGGVDPAPKAWHALMNGAIPIVCSAGVKGAYSHFPVVFVDDWDANAITESKLAEWKSLYVEWFDNSKQRNELLRRLGIEYWWGLVSDTYNNVVEQPVTSEHAEI